MKNNFVFLAAALAVSVGASEPVDPSSMKGKILCGYQGWFRTPDDGAGQGWTHYGMKGKFEPGFSAVEAWPDVSEFDADEKYETLFRHKDGTPAHVFSSVNPKTVMRHFKWMEDYGIDGVYLQRFVGVTKNPKGRAGLQTVMANVRAGAEKHNRTWAMMYDLSGANETDLMTTVVDDWKRLCSEDGIRKDRMYLHHNGKPVVAVWGMGFTGGRKYTLAQCLELINFLKADGNAVMVGVPTYWREMKADCLPDPLMLEVAKAADIVSPWAVGRFSNLKDASNYVQNVAAKDMAWCKENGRDFLPVVFPGFSWYNLQKGREKEAKFNQIPRLRGRFLAEQLRMHILGGAEMVYVAMFDEIDEGTAIFKCTNNPPVGESLFLDMDGLDSDLYLKLVGRATSWLKKKVDCEK